MSQVRCFVTNVASEAFPWIEGQKENGQKRQREAHTVASHEYIREHTVSIDSGSTTWQQIQQSPISLLEHIFL